MRTATRFLFFLSLVGLFVPVVAIQGAHGTQSRFSFFPAQGTASYPLIAYQQGTGAYATAISYYNSRANVSLDTSVNTKNLTPNTFATQIIYTYGSTQSGTFADTQTNDNSTYLVSASERHGNRYRINYYYAYNTGINPNGAGITIRNLTYFMDGKTSSPQATLDYYNFTSSSWASSGTYLDTTETLRRWTLTTGAETLLNSTGGVRLRLVVSDVSGTFTVSVDFTQVVLNYTLVSNPATHYDVLRLYNNSTGNYRVRLDYSGSNNTAQMWVYNVSLTTTQGDGTETLQTAVKQGTVVIGTGTWVTIDSYATLYVKTVTQLKDDPSARVGTWLTLRIAPTASLSPTFWSTSLQLILYDYTL